VRVTPNELYHRGQLPIALQQVVNFFAPWGFMAPLTCIQSELLGPCSKTGLTSFVEIYT